MHCPKFPPVIAGRVFVRSHAVTGPEFRPAVWSTAGLRVLSRSPHLACAGYTAPALTEDRGGIMNAVLVVHFIHLHVSSPFKYQALGIVRELVVQTWWVSLRFSIPKIWLAKPQFLGLCGFAMDWGSRRSSDFFVEGHVTNHAGQPIV
jgi:hypothetical protein